MKIPIKSQFQVVKSNFTKNNIQEIPEDHLNLSEGEILVQIDLFSFTSNNITYAVSGNIIRYWEFFPALGEHIQEWGVIPVWGFADVVESKTESIPVGDRIFGYFPPATHLKMKADRITKKRFIDGSKHRATLPPTYNLYKRVLSESNYDKNFDRDRALFYPLYITSFCLWDSLKENNWHGAKQIVIKEPKQIGGLGKKKRVGGSPQSDLDTQESELGSIVVSYNSPIGATISNKANSNIGKALVNLIDSSQKTLASLGWIAMPRTSRRPSVLTATATITAIETMRPPSRSFT